MSGRNHLGSDATREISPGWPNTRTTWKRSLSVACVIMTGVSVTVTGTIRDYIVEAENLAAGADWTHHPMGAFRRQGEWFVDVTTGRKPDHPYRAYRLTLTPAVPRREPGSTRTGTPPTAPPTWVSSPLGRWRSRPGTGC